MTGDLAVLTFKLDESYRNDYVFAVSGVLADTEGWCRIHNTISHSLDFENGRLPPDMRVKRYHAVEMNGLDGEYRSWNNPAGRVRERRMTDRLLQTLGENARAVIAVGLDLKAHSELFPSKPPSDSYVLCMQAVMEMIGEWMEGNGMTEQVALIHDRGHDDGAARHAFEKLTKDPSWRHYRQFPSIEPKSSLDDIGLQAADRIAYESFKEMCHQMRGDPPVTRPALAELRNRIFHCYGYHLDRDGLQQVWRLENESGG